MPEQPAAPSAWDDRLYLRFGDQRSRAALELLARVRPQPETVRTVVDLGCGPGNSTALLHARWPQARVIGVDSSATMLRAARTALPTVEWIEADVAAWTPPEGVDVLFANALLQWVPGHLALLQRWFAALRPGGVLAFQVPDNRDEPSHRGMRERPGPWAALLAGAAEVMAHVQPAEVYYDLLAPQAAEVDVWTTRYEQVMADAAAIVDWVRATGLRPYLDAIPEPAMRADYLQAYLAHIEAAYPIRADGRRLFGFPRLFVVARR